MSLINARNLTLFRMVTFGEDYCIHIVHRGLLKRRSPAGTTILFSVLIICLSADLISLTQPAFYYSFAAFSLATGLISVLTLVPMCVLTKQG